MRGIVYGLEMPTAAIAAAAIIGGGIAGLNYMGQSKAASAAKAAAGETKRQAMTLESRLTESANEIDVAASKYSKELQALSDTYSPYDFTAAYASLYDSIIAPMDRDMQENVLPGIKAAYSGFGGGTSTGAYKETVANTLQKASEAKSLLRAQEREKAIARNLDEYNRKVGTLTGVLSAETMAPTVRAQQAPTIFNAQSQSIAATLAAKQQAAMVLPNSITAGLQGAFGVYQMLNGVGQSQQPVTQGTLTPSPIA